MRLTFLLFLFMWIGSAQTTVPAVQLEAGIAKEEVDGDLKSAMEIYQKVAANTAAPRDVRAKALLHIGGCYEKLGKQARQVYEQVVRDYADQPAASQARTRLASLKQQEHPAAPTTMTVRKIDWSGVGQMSDSDTDGQRAVFADSTGNLFFGDLAGHSKRMIFKAEPDRRPDWTPARDFAMVCIRLQSKPNHPGVLAVIKTDGTGYRELIRDDAQGTILGWWFDVTWSWDDRYLLVRTTHEENASRKLWLVNVANGQRRELLSPDAGYFNKAVFSPDGRFIAYEIAPLPDRAETSRVFIMAIQGGHARQVYESVPKPVQHQLGMEVWTLLDWTADGHYLALADAPKGKTALYLLPVQNGAAVGNRVFIRYGEFESAYTTAAGALVYQSPAQADFFLSSFDSDGRLGPWKRLDMRGGNRVNPLPSFTSDSSHIAYVAEDEDPVGGASLVLYDLSNSNERVLFRSGRMLFCQSATRTTVIYCTADKGSGRTDLTSVSLESGEVQFLESFKDPKGIVRWMPRPSPQDGKALYLSKYNLMEGDGPIVRWDLATHKETEVMNPRDADRFP